MNTATVLIEINCAPGLQELLSDWLLERDPGQGFTVIEVRGHGTGEAALSLAEQVRGSQRRVQLQMERSADYLASFNDDVRQRFAGMDLYVRVLPVIQSVHLKQR